MGASPAIGLAFSLLAPGGTLSSVGVPSAPFPFTPGEAYDKNLTYRIGRCPVRSLLPSSIDLLQRIRRGECGVCPPMDPRSLIVSHRFALRDAAEAYRLFTGRLDGCTKAVLYPRDDELELYAAAAGGGAT